MTEKELQDCLDAFKNAVKKLDLTNSKKINFFSATKMLTLETKHSAFLAWLLDPSLEHCLKSAVLEKLLSKLYDYKTVGDKKTVKPKSNYEVLKDNKQGRHKSIVSKQDLLKICSSSTIEVDTEHYTENNKRIDILLRITDSSNNKRTVIVIENKIDSTVHDNQILEYQNYIYDSNKFLPYERKIFIYLTKFGELPYNNGGNGGYNEEWCVFDYSKIVEIIVEIIGELNLDLYIISQSERSKLIHILEDYKNMVDTSILQNSSVARDQCEECLNDAKVRAAFDYLTAYTKIYTPAQISNYVCQRLGGKTTRKKSTWFYLDSFKEYFERKGEKYSIYKLRCVCQCSGGTKKQDSKIVIFVDAEIKDLSPAQDAVLKAYGHNGKGGQLIGSFILVDESKRGYPFEKLQPILDDKIDEFKRLHLDELEKKLATL
ncbi:MAG: PD-(D/E)XK nuclease family protein [Candidatus Coproplasma sp.]